MKKEGQKSIAKKNIKNFVRNQEYQIILKNRERLLINKK